MKLVVDPSIAIKWVVEEQGRAEALHYTAGQEMLAPEFVLVEVANILWKKVRLGELERGQAVHGMGFVEAAYDQLVPTRELPDAALALSFDLDHPVYDCMYVAFAEREGVDLVTADGRLARKLQASGKRPAIYIPGAAP